MKKPNKKRRPIQFTPNTTEDSMIEKLIASGLHGRTRSKVVQRLVDEGLQRRFFQVKP